MRPRPWPRVLVATFALLLALEGLASITENAPKYRLAPLTGYELVPGYRHDGESVNLHGLRGAEIGPRRPDVPRVLCVGGSTTWGHHVRDEEAWPALLAGELERRLGRPVEVLNAGVSGWGLEQMVLSLEAGRLDLLQPDVVLVHAGWNWPVLDGNRQVARFHRDLTAPAALGWLARSALARRVQHLLLEGDPPVLAGDPSAPRPSYVEALALHVPPLLARAAAACRARGVRLAVLRPPGLVQRGPPLDATARAAWLGVLTEDRSGGLPADEAVSRAGREHAAILAALDAGARAADLALLDLAGRLVATLPAADADRSWTGWFMDEAHLTPAGHAACARVLAELLQEADLPVAAGAAR